MGIDPKELIRWFMENGQCVRSAARKFGVAPGTVIYWRDKSKDVHGYPRYRSLRRQSTRPQTGRITTIIPSEQDEITRARKETGFCAQKIKGIVKTDKHHRTIHRFIKRKGLVKESGRHLRPTLSGHKNMHSKNVKTLGKLQMDVKYVTPELSGLDHTCYLYAVMDILSRYKQGIIFPLLDQSYSIEAVEHILPVIPVNADFIQTDNGLEFQDRFHKFVTEEKILKHHYIHKSNPNENAVIERSFRTDEEEFFCFRLGRLGKPKNIAELNIFYQLYLKEYNETRPHLSLDLMTPKEKVQQVQSKILQV